LPKETPPWMMTALIAMSIKTPDAVPPSFDEPPQNMREYDPEWGRAFYAGTATVNCDHAHMLASARAPVLFTHHYRAIDPGTGTVMAPSPTSKSTGPASWLPTPASRSRSCRFPAWPTPCTARTPSCSPGQSPAGRRRSLQTADGRATQQGTRDHRYRHRPEPLQPD
jgi:hypothetical protein